MKPWPPSLQKNILPLLQNIETSSWRSIEGYYGEETTTRGVYVTSTTIQSTIVVLQQQRVEDQGSIKETKISLPTKFDGSTVHFRGFLNKVRFVIQMHPTSYPIDASRVGLVGT